MVHPPLLHFIRAEFTATIGLNTLNREWRFLNHAFQEINGVFGRTPRIDTQDVESRAVVDCGELINARRNLHCVHLNPIARNRPAV